MATDWLGVAKGITEGDSVPIANPKVTPPNMNLVHCQSCLHQHRILVEDRGCDCGCDNYQPVLSPFIAVMTKRKPKPRESWWLYVLAWLLMLAFLAYALGGGK